VTHSSFNEQRKHERYYDLYRRKDRLARVLLHAFFASTLPGRCVASFTPVPIGQRPQYNYVSAELCPSPVIVRNRTGIIVIEQESTNDDHLTPELLQLNIFKSVGGGDVS